MKRIVIGMSLGIMMMPGIMSAADWTEKVKVKGDLRYRHETIKQDEDHDARNRHRIRARIGIEATPTDNIKLGLQLASGSDDPVSTNQSLDEGFSTKEIRLDLAYVDLHFKQAPGLNIIAGKMANPFYKPGGSELVWDSDLNPEGGILKYSSPNEKVKFFTNIGGFWVEERSSSPDTWLFGGQAGIEFSLSGDASATLGASYYDYGNIQGFAPVYDDDSFGNTLDEGGDFMYDYNIVEVFGEIGFKAGKVPIEFFMDYVKNVADGVVNCQGWLIGAKIGKLKDPISWELRYIYRDVEADAVFGTFTDSDFFGGGTNGMGSEFGFEYQIAKAWQAGATYFLNEPSLVSGDNFHRVQLDLQFKF